MITKKKTFDCVEMKRQIQEALQAEYRSRKQDFPSYAAFLEAKANASPWVQEMRRRFSGGE
jgi:hypothetical protein